MPDKYTFAVVGGDKRFVCLTRLLAGDGHRIYINGLDSKELLGDGDIRPAELSEAADAADCVLLPLPITTDGLNVNAPFARSPVSLESIAEAVKPGQLLTAGMIPRGFCELCEKKGIRIVDYFEREELMVQNAVPSAEGAIQIAMEETPFTIHGSNCLVMGFGRIGKILCKNLAGLGANVTSCARRHSDLAFAYSYGYRAAHVSELENILPEMNLIFNTVPDMIFDKIRLNRAKSQCLLIDLASKPGGVDFEYAKLLGLQVIWALSLPGKVAPLTSAAIIKNTVYNIIGEG